MARLIRRALGPLRHGLPRWIERHVPGPGPAAAARRCRRIGLAGSVGYFHRAGAAPAEIVAAYRAVAGGCDAVLAVKAPALGFAEAALAALVATGREIVLDAHAEPQAAPTLALARRFAGVGAALPARWQRSAADAAALRDAPARLRLVKGEWADPAGDMADIPAAYLALARQLAGRAAPVGIATHDPALAEAALTLLREAGTPCELEQLRGLPRRRTMAIAARLGVPVRLYCPFGPGWWPYALDSALDRPYLPRWWWADWRG